MTPPLTSPPLPPATRWRQCEVISAGMKMESEKVEDEKKGRSFGKRKFD